MQIKIFHLYFLQKTISYEKTTFIISYVVHLHNCYYYYFNLQIYKSIKPQIIKIMKKMFIFTVMLGYAFINSSLYSLVSPQDTGVEPYCGFDEIDYECRMTTKGSVCITYDDCKELDVNPNNPDNPNHNIVIFHNLQ